MKTYLLKGYQPGASWEEHEKQRKLWESSLYETLTPWQFDRHKVTVYYFGDRIEINIDMEEDKSYFDIPQFITPHFYLENTTVFSSVYKKHTLLRLTFKSY